MVNIKILIIGPVASGKSTFARKLAMQYNISHYEIDLIVHDDFNGRKRSIDEQLKIISEINTNNCWIIEGTLRKNLDILLEYADIIIFLDIPIYVRKYRIIKRFIKQKFGIEKSHYKPTFKILRQMYVWTYEFEKNKREFEKRLLKYRTKLVYLDSVKRLKNYDIITRSD